MILKRPDLISWILIITLVITILVLGNRELSIQLHATFYESTYFQFCELLVMLLTVTGFTYSHLIGKNRDVERIIGVHLRYSFLLLVGIQFIRWILLKNIANDQLTLFLFTSFLVAFFSLTTGFIFKTFYTIGNRFDKKGSR